MLKRNLRIFRVLRIDRRPDVLLVFDPAELLQMNRNSGMCHFRVVGIQLTQLRRQTFYVRRFTFYVLRFASERRQTSPRGFDVLRKTYDVQRLGSFSPAGEVRLLFFRQFF